jgi:NitT/TauT family transport system permease protein
MAHSYTTSGVNKTVINGKHSILTELFIFTGLILILYFIIIMATQWHSPINYKFSINLSYAMLPYYAILSTGRMAIAYVISLVFSLVYARIAVMSKRAEGIMIPILDVLQSIPILSFMPGVVLGLVALFPHTNLGLELSAVILIFTSQAWNITFGFYQTLLTNPQDLKEVALINHFNFWQRFTRLEIPAGMISLIWNSMMSWSGGWFFLMASEQFTLGKRSFQLPGLGSYLQAAASKDNLPALFFGLGTLICVIVLLDQLLWRPLVAWGDRFKIEQDESSEKPHSWFLNLLGSSRVVGFIKRIILTPVVNLLDIVISNRKTFYKGKTISEKEINPTIPVKKILNISIICVLVYLLLFGVIETVDTIKELPLFDWKMILTGTVATFLRTLAALVISTLWTVPVGVAIGLNPKLSKRIQPLVQMTASIPATALFPAILLILLTLPSGLNIAAIILMLLGTQWYLLFNVIAGAMAIPNDLREATAIYKISGWQKWRYLILPSIFPYLVTGMITATGGAWNASIVSEYVTFAGKVYQTSGLGAIIAEAANSDNFRLLLASTLTMAILVFMINRFFWQRIYHLAESKYHFE